MFTSRCMMCYDHISFLVQLSVFSGLGKCFSPTWLVFHVPVLSIFLHALKLSSQTFLQMEAHQTVHQFRIPSGVLSVLAERSCSVPQHSFHPSFSAPLHCHSCLFFAGWKHHFLDLMSCLLVVFSFLPWLLGKQ